MFFSRSVLINNSFRKMFSINTIVLISRTKIFNTKYEQLLISVFGSDLYRIFTVVMG